VVIGTGDRWQPWNGYKVAVAVNRTGLTQLAHRELAMTAYVAGQSDEASFARVCEGKFFSALATVQESVNVGSNLLPE
jgi:hypothetical protein